MMQRPTFLMRRRGLLAAAACALAVFAGWLVWSRSKRPLNVVLVTFDTTRADRLGAYGYPRGLTESFDRLAGQNVVFDRAYAPAPLTLPSHATMLTGLYPPEHGLRVNGSGSLGDDVPLLPALLKRRGYDTGAFVAAFVLHSKFGLSRGFDVYDDDLSDAEPAGEHSFDRRRAGLRVVDAALKWLEQRTARPFFCWIHLYDAHAPYDARKEQFGDRFEREPYDAGIAVEVQQMARVLQFLKDRQLQERTVIVVAGDHGEGLGEHGEDEHGNFLYNTTVRVPLVVVAPGNGRAGHRVTEPVSLVDLAPTLLDMLGLPVPKVMRGRSLRAAVAGRGLSPRPCYAETEAPFLDNRWCPMQAVITERWKYIRTTRGELFDLAQDPGETNNLWEADPGQRDKLHAVLQELQERFVHFGTANIHLSEKDARVLASLGYVAGKTEGSDQAMAAEVLPDMKDMLPYQARIQEVRKLTDAGEIQQAVELAREIVAATVPSYPTAEVILGDLLRQQGSSAEAAAVYRAVLERNPDCIKAHARLGDLCASQGEWRQAADEYRSVIRLEPEAAHAHFDLALTLLRMDQPDEALMEFEEAIRSDPGFVTAHFQLGLLLAKRRRFEQAVFCFRQALKYEPRLSDAHMNLGSVLLQLNRNPEALAHVREAVEIDPDWFEARFLLGTLLSAQQQFKDALVQFQEARRLRPDDPLPQKRIEQVEAQIGRDR
jgi:arylsulfatase A-like enzyme/Tfp pilus assembly protein PilF